VRVEPVEAARQHEDRRLAQRLDLGKRLVAHRHRVEEDERAVLAARDHHAAPERHPRHRAVDGPEVVLELLQRLMRGDDPGARRLGHGPA
jgi:hypothetical protein